MTTENVKSADRKPEVYTDPNGKKRVRMVAVDREIVKKESKVNEISTNTLRKYVDKAGPKADAGDKKRQDGESRAAKKITKSSDVKIHSTENTEDDDPCWDTHKKVGTKMKGGKRVNDCVPKNESSELGEAMYKVEIEGLPATYIDGASPSQVKQTLRKLLKKPDFIRSIQRTPEAEMKKHFRDKAVGKEVQETTQEEGYRDPFKSAQRSAKYKELSHEYEKEKEFSRLSKLRKMRQKPVKKEESGENNNPKKKDISVSDYKKKTGKKTVSLKHLTKNTHIDPFKEETAMKSFKSVVSELTDKERAAIAASKAKRLGKKAAVASKRQAEKDRPKRAKAGEDDHVIMQLRKAQDVGGNAEIRFHKGKSGKSNAKDIGHALKFHDTLKKPEDKRKLRIQLAKGGPAAVTKYANLYRKVTKTS